MQTLQGIAVSPGVAIGEALVIDNEGFRIPRRFVSRDAVDEELQRLNNAIELVAVEIQENRDRISAELGDQYGAIFAAHLQMLRDPQLIDEMDVMVREKNFSPEYAVSRTLRRYAKVFQSLENAYMAERAQDILDIEKSLLRNLLGQAREDLTHLISPVVVLAHNLTPSETARLDPKLVLGFVTEIGGLGGHTAIVAEALEIPAIVGAGKFLNDVSGGDLVIVDGDEGRMLIDPDSDSLRNYQQQVVNRKRQAESLTILRDEPADTLDGIHVRLTANIEFPQEVETCLERGADGVGLYRTEFLYLGVDKEPTEEDHYKAYVDVIQAMGNDRPVVIRTLDLGADKMGKFPYVDDNERNPFLGVRSIRLSLRHLDLFRVQLRAILRASHFGTASIMFPLIATLQELRQAKLVLAEVMEDLEEDGIPFDKDIQVGMMVEVPSAVIMLDRFVKEVDFISIGTNDLVQYTLAVDRSNKEVAELYRASDPAVLRLIRSTIQVAREADLKTNLCGQMCGNPKYTMLLLGLGLRGMSVRPSAILEIKKICRSVTIEQCEELAERVMEMDTAREVDRFLRQRLRQVLPETMTL